MYAIQDAQIGVTRNGSPFLKCLLRDASSECPARKWSLEDESAYREVDATGFVRILGRTELYKDQIQVILDEIEPTEVDSEQIRRLVPATCYDIGEMFSEVRAILESVEHPALTALVGAYLDDEKLMDKFRRAPAAKNLHHAWIGGLLEHTLQLLKLADRMLPLYPNLNRDLVLVGLFLHDLAKTSELSWAKGFEYTTLGKLVGHIVIGSMILERKAAEIAKAGAPLPPIVRVVLHHIILSHHDKPEFGAAKRPSTPEAIFVALLDNLDAKTNMALHHAGREEECVSADGDGFTEKVWALETSLYAPDPMLDGAPLPPTRRRITPTPNGAAGAAPTDDPSRVDGSPSAKA